MKAAIVRRLVLATVTVAALAAPQLARAQAPGSLAQFASPNDCIQETSSSIGCSSSTPGLSGSDDVAITSDGNNVYVIAQSDESITEFARNADGSLSPIGCIADKNDSGTTCTNATASDLVSPRAIAISPDGNDVYVAGTDDNGNGDVAEFARNADGTLTQLSSKCISENQEAISDCGDRAFGLKQPSAIVVSPDNQNVYVTDVSGKAITTLARAADGSLSGGSGDCIAVVDSSNTDCPTQAAGLESPVTVVVSPDGSNVYVGSDQSPGAIAEFTRAADGKLSPLASPNDCIQEHDDTLACGTETGVGINAVGSLAVSPDGKNLYATSNGATGDIAEFSRNANAQGALTQLSSPNDCIEEDGSTEVCGTTNGLGLNGAAGVKVSPDGHSVYVATQTDDCSCDDAVAEFARASDGHLTQLASPDSCIDSGNECPTTGIGLGGGALAISPDDTNVYVIGGADVAELARTPFRHTLTVSLAGSGGGSVLDGSHQISCPTTCSGAYNEGNQVTLTVLPSSGSTFAGWGGACSGTGSCQVTMSSDLTVTATFSTVPVSSSPGAPAPVLTGTPTAVTDSAAGFSGSVNPEGLPTTVFFQYGLDKRYSPAGGSGPNYTAQTPAQSVGSDFSDHTVGPVAVSGLVPNALYHFRLVATNSAGTAFGQDVTFTTALAPDPAPPTIGQSFNVAPVSGLVLVLIHGQLVPITQVEQLPPGVTIDSRQGTFQLITSTGGGGSAHDAAAKGETQSGKFGGAVVRIHQIKGGPNRGLTTVMMVLSAFKGAPSQALCNTGAAGDAHAAASKVLQLLHASAHGKFRTSGRYSAATVRGTAWSMTARCDGTLTHVITDSVIVTDFISHKTIVLHAGQSYLAPSHHKK